MRLGKTGMVAAAGVLMLAAGCTHYYKVNDPAGNKDYYTTDIETAKSGAVKLKDEKSGAVVTLQSSEVKEISEKEFEAGVKGSEKKP